MSSSSFAVASRPLTPTGTAIPGLKEAFCFLVPALIAFEVGAVGRLFVPEILLLMVLPFLLVDRRRKPFYADAKVLIVLAVVWLWALVVSDLYRGSAFGDYSRGWAKVLFLIVNFVALYLLIGDSRRRIFLTAAGLSAGLFLKPYVAPDRLSLADGWKFGIGYPITLAVVLAACHPRLFRLPFVSAALCTTIGVVNLSKGFRSLAGICILTAGYLVIHQFTRGNVRWISKISPARAVAVAAVAAVATIGVLNLYGYAARRGFLGTEAATKYEQQASGRFGLLFGGRPQLYSEALAIADAPLIGHGSWAQGQRYSLNLLKRLYEAGYRENASTTYGLTHTYYIPTHSYLLGAWVEGGILAALLWFAALMMCLRAFLTAYRLTEPALPLIAFLMIGLFWDIILSPFGAQQRLEAAFVLVVLLFVRRRIEAAGEPEISAA